MPPCMAMKDITIGGDHGPENKAALVCDLDAGHESLHLDEQDQVWWRPAESDSPLETED